MKLKTAFNTSGWIIWIIGILFIAYTALNPRPHTPPSDTIDIVDVTPDISDDSSFSWFPEVVEVPVPFAVPGPIQYIPSKPDTVFIDSSKKQLVALKDYIARQYIFKLRYVQPKLQVSYISADSVESDTLSPYFVLAEYNLPPAFQIVPLGDGTYDVQRMELTVKPIKIKPPTLTYQTWGGIKFPLSLYVRQEAYWKTLRTSLELNVDAEALVTAQIGIGIQIK